MAKAPAFQFYPGDWQRDLSEHPLEIEGAWIRICCAIWWSETPGTATKPLTNWARVLRVGEKKSLSIIQYLLNQNIADVVIQNTTITITSRRMVHDEHIRNIRRCAGSKGGNPAIVGHKKEADLDKQNLVNQNPTPSSSSSSSDLKDSSSTLPCTNTDNSIERASANADTLPEKKVSKKQMPKDFSLTPEREAYAKAKGLNGSIPAVWEAFTLHHQSKGTTMQDWNKAWMKWVLNEVKFHPSDQARSKRTGLEDWQNLPDEEDVPL